MQPTQRRTDRLTLHFFAKPFRLLSHGSVAKFEHDGCLVIGAVTNELPSVNPFTAKTEQLFPEISDAPLDHKIATAHSGYLAWRAWKPSARAAIVLSAALMLRERIDEFATPMIPTSKSPKCTVLLAGTRMHMKMRCS